MGRRGPLSASARGLSLDGSVPSHRSGISGFGLVQSSSPISRTAIRLSLLDPGNHALSQSNCEKLLCPSISSYIPL